MDYGFKKHIQLAILTLIIIALGGFIYSYVSSPMVVTVTGIGEVSAPTQKAKLSLTASEINDSPVVASANLNNKLDTIKAVLIQNGFVESEITRSQIRIIPASSLVAGANGYAASATLAGSTTQVDNLSNLTGMLYEKGASLVSQPALEVEDQDKLETKALNAAIKDAANKANSIGTKRLKFIRKLVAVVPANTANTSTVTSTAMSESAEDPLTSPETFKLTKAVQVSYKMW